MRIGKMVTWKGFKARVEQVAINEVKIRITSTWAPFCENRRGERIKCPSIS